MSISRRNFLKMSVGSAALTATSAAIAKEADGVMVPKRKFGRHPDRVSVVGIGGHTLYMAGSQREANEITHRALDRGINFFDNAWDYHGGEAETYMGVALEGKRDKAFLMSKFCNYHTGSAANAYSPDVKGAMAMLEDSLRRLKTDHIDLWLMHQVSHDDLKDAYRAEGGIEAIELAKKQGKIRYGGFSGHWKPSLNLEMIEGGYAWDSMLMPVSAVGAMQSRGFEELMPLCKEKGIAVLGMKGFGGSRRTELHSKVTVKEVLQYALSYPEVCTHLVGIDKLDYVNQAVASSVASPFTVTQRKAYGARFEFEANSPEFAAQYHGGKLYEGGHSCMRRDTGNA